jgi:hypothetical protein
MVANGLLDTEGLKIEGDAAHAAEVGLFFQRGENPPIKADVIAVNEPRTLKAVVPAALLPGGLGPAPAYTVKIVTQSSARTNKQLLKNIREMHAEFTLTPQV